MKMFQHILKLLFCKQKMKYSDLFLKKNYFQNKIQIFCVANGKHLKLQSGFKLQVF